MKSKADRPNYLLEGGLINLVIVVKYQIAYDTIA